MLDEIEWVALDVDLKGEAYEGLLQKFAAEQKGAGQYFTPRPLIRTVVQCLRPDIRESPDFTVHDPAAGTGGFLIGAAEGMFEATQGQLSRADQRRMRRGTYSGGELVLETRRLALMNLYLHEIEGDIHYGDSIAEGDPGARYDVVLTNPPFGTKGAGEVPSRDDFTVATSNKQLNFIQHVLTVLKPGGRAGVVLPDNVLFEEHAGRDVRRLLMADCQLHTILRLPVGTFTPYSPGVKANVLFFRKGLPTEEVWVYDLRTNVDKVTKRKPLTEAHLPISSLATARAPHHVPTTARRRSASSVSPAGRSRNGTTTWTSFGCGTRAWRTPRICRSRRTCWARPRPGWRRRWTR